MVVCIGSGLGRFAWWGGGGGGRAGLIICLVGLSGTVLVSEPNLNPKPLNLNPKPKTVLGFRVLAEQLLCQVLNPTP